jgi:hypothetical protein
MRLQHAAYFCECRRRCKPVKRLGADHRINRAIVDGYIFCGARSSRHARNRLSELRQHLLHGLDGDDVGSGCEKPASEFAGARAEVNHRAGFIQLQIVAQPLIDGEGIFGPAARVRLRFSCEPFGRCFMHGSIVSHPGAGVTTVMRPLWLFSGGRPAPRDKSVLRAWGSRCRRRVPPAVAGSRRSCPAAS